MTEKRIHVVFKTHLDIGFTDHAEKIRQQYHERFIPQAIETGAHFHNENPDEPMFIWTTGAWLIWDHLHSRSKQEVARLEQAIERGLIRWHALPFTTHTELMSPDLFGAGLSYAQELDRRFGLKTIAAKMTDVPGHTLGMVPLLAEAGVRFLHIGVNSASPPPEIPDVFRWRAPDGAEIVVMYQRSYGETYFPEGLSDGLSFAHTSDNIGPQSVSQAAEAYRDILRHEPGATVCAATLEDYGKLMWEARERFPIVEKELGDSWIHGSGTDPEKIARYLALQRLYGRFAEERMTASRQAFGRKLTLVAEHTCGVDIKSFLRDEKAWARPAFEAARKTDPRFHYTEASWAEQRAYLDQAVAELDGEDAARARAALGDLAIPARPEPTHAVTRLDVGGWIIDLDPATGDVAALTAPDGRTIRGADGSLIAYRYESYDAGDVRRHMDTYLTQWMDWAVLDHDKPGLAAVAEARSQAYRPELRGMTATSILAAMPAEAVERFGAPAEIALAFSAAENGLDIRLTLYGKSANRMPEASFLSFTPEGRSAWRVRKMGLWHATDNFARAGGAQLQAVTAVRGQTEGGAELLVENLDTPLVAPQTWPFMAFCKDLPDYSAGIRFNIHNNKWGTNFPMWWGGDFTTRFKLSVSEPG
ncbi:MULTISPECIES: DUF5054 domain-containing protein [unclassified Ensifer]|uniref:DUF5054 domain-containing protein n=1 Tax=unclassified Ensifer TaxID=2633371 RepID=UPI0008134D62|nr:MULTISPECIES: DUF5054 domain-containing protein [unclassified Ensifer]OCP02819.1 DUF5054 domain-containing protein [Ensifer sp. LC14]OCP13720.1 DUF5054 domain-containing protein [Ensifer sp. LC13]OCP14377.1 DUF5054 domain-containing protein [Ensifer sp. LC11]OCP29083.1 DUF5054 domain-containing protein [Ensifer sp. LC499]